MVRSFFWMILVVFLPMVAVAEVNPLQADQAFKFSSHLQSKNQLMLEWQIAPGCHLYRDRVSIKTLPDSQVKIDKLQLPLGKTIQDKVGESYSVYVGLLKIPVNLTEPAVGVLTLAVNYQGCSDQGFCYPPQKRNLRIDLSKPMSASHIIVTNEVSSASKDASIEVGPENQWFEGKNNFVVILTFLGLGLLLAFTPCVLPMIPILSGIIIGHGKNLNVAKAFFLSLAYVLGMAITYAIAGMIVALLGSHVQSVFQTTPAILFVSGIFILLALSLFGFYDLQMPTRWLRRLTALNNKQKGGTYIGVFLMGMLSSLIVSPCVSAPLVGVLTYIAQTGNVWIGGASLLALGLGMGIPLLLIGVSAGKILPKSGPWMIFLERSFGIVLLAVAIIMLSRIIPGPIVLILWAILFICTAIFMGLLVQSKTNTQNVVRGLAVILLIYGIILIIGAVLGNRDPLHPWENIGSERSKKQLTYVVIKNKEQLAEEFALAQKEEKPIMLDFYADWCTACNVMERYIFSRADVQKELSDYIVLKADVTAGNSFDKELLQRFNVVAPPTILFFNPDGKEITQARIVGEVNKKEFLDHLPVGGLR